MSINTLAIDMVDFSAPNDLMTLKELALKYGCSYDYLYKWSVREKVIQAYFRGTWKLSEKDVIEFITTKTKKRLSEVKSCKGGES